MTQHTATQNPQPPASRAEKIVGIAVFGGLAVISAALLWPISERLAPSAPDVEPIEVSSVVETIAPATVTPPPVAIEIAEAEAEPVEAPKTAIAIAHEEGEVDFVARSLRALDTGDLAGALEALRKHLHGRPESPELLRQVGSLARQVGARELAEAALSRAAFLAPLDPEPHVERARLALDAGDAAGAETAGLKAVSLDKEHALAWNLVGRAAMAQSEWHRAEAALRRAVELEPTHATLHNNLGLLYVKMRRGEAAVDTLETAVDLYDDDVPPFVFNNLGLAYEMIEAFEDARDAYEQALSADPLYTKARINLERVLTTIAQLESESDLALARGPDLAPERDED
jgi:tetratricopeptide (TPR) repeat protein